MEYKTKVLVVGAGISGLIMSRMLTKQNIDHIVVERSYSLPTLHLHYIHEDVGSFFGSKLKRIGIKKSIFWNGKFLDHASVEMQNHFSYITTEKLFNNSSSFTDRNDGWVPEEGWRSFHEKFASLCDPVKFGMKLHDVDLVNNVATLHSGRGFTDPNIIRYRNIVFTIPLPAILPAVNYFLPEGKLLNSPIPVHTLELTEQEVSDDVFQIIYLPKGNFGFCRVSLMNRKILAEETLPQFRNDAQRSEFPEFLRTWLPILKKRKDLDMRLETNFNGRFIVHDEGFRIGALKYLEANQIHALGRYATYSYKRTDHIIDDAQAIMEKLI